tara:strand:- start:171 stop:302 length:132 start_codon:yes stop_codon:yes gene_type:complete
MHPDHKSLYIETAILSVLLLAALYASYRAYGTYNYEKGKNAEE